MQTHTHRHKNFFYSHVFATKKNPRVNIQALCLQQPEAWLEESRCESNGWVSGVIDIKDKVRTLIENAKDECCDIREAFDRGKGVNRWAYNRWKRGYFGGEQAFVLYLYCTVFLVMYLCYSVLVKDFKWNVLDGIWQQWPLSHLNSLQYITWALSCHSLSCGVRMTLCDILLIPSII